MSLSGNIHAEVAFGKTWKDTFAQNRVDNLDNAADVITAPSHARLQITGKIELRGWATLSDWTPGGETPLIRLFDTNQQQYQVSLDTAGKLLFYWSTTGSDSGLLTCVDALGFTNGEPGHFAVTFDPADGAGSFFKHAAGYHAAPAALSDWTALTNPSAFGATSIFVGSSEARLGHTALIDSQWYEAQIWNGFQSASGTLAANPRFHDVAQWAVGDTASTGAVDGPGNTWTLEGAASIVGDWANVSTDVRRVQYSRGRLYESDEYEAGRATVELNNEDRAYEPAFTGGANYPNVVPWVPVRVRAEYGGYSEIRWQGFAETWDVTYPDAATHSVTTIRCSDAFRLFNRLSLFSYETEVAADSPTAWWKLQETSGTTATDSGSLAVDGTYVNTPTLGQTGPITGMLAVSFDDASTEEVAVGTLTGSDVGADYTVECWFNVDSGDANNFPAIVQVDTDTGIIWNRVDDPEFYVGFGVPLADVGSWQSLVVPVLLAEDTWYHVAFAVDYSAKKATPYVNGVQYADLNFDLWDQTRSTGTMTVKIAELSTASANFDGLIAQVAIYDSLLSAGRIAAHAEAVVHAFAAETYDTRIGNILTATEWGGGTDLRAGQSTLTTLTNPDSSVLVALRRAAQSEDGEVLIGRDGRVVGRDRYAREEIQTSSNFTFQENFQDVRVTMDDTLIFNQTKITTAASETFRASDSASQVSYGPRQFSRSNVDTSATDASDMALAIVARFKNPELRIEKIMFRPEGNPSTLWPQFRDRDIGDLITLVVEPPPKTGSPINENLYIERISANLTPETVDIVLQCSPANRQALWILNVSTLNETTVVAY